MNLKFVFFKFVDIYKHLSLNIIIIKYIFFDKLLLKYSKTLKFRINKLNINIFAILYLHFFTFS